MATLSKGYTFGATEQVTAAKLSTLVDGGGCTGIVNADIASAAAIADSKLAQLTTASKVSGATFISLASIPAGGGTIPIANIPYKDEDDMATDSASYVPTQQSTKAYVDTKDTAQTSALAAKFHTTTGHHHDGSDAKKVICTDLDMTGTTTTQILYNNGGTLASKAETAHATIGDWASATTGSATQATTAGFLVARYDGSGGLADDVTIKIDSSNPPTTVRGGWESDLEASGVCTFPVRINDYYLITFNGGDSAKLTFSWIPFA